MEKRIYPTIPTAPPEDRSWKYTLIVIQLDQSLKI